MSKIAEKKALEAYPMDEYEFDKAKKSNIERSRYAYIKGYDQALQDMDNLQKDAKCQEETEEVTLAKLNATIQYNQGLKDGYDQAFKDFLKKAENAISMISRHYIGENYSFEQVWEQFKNYMQDESEN